MNRLCLLLALLLCTVTARAADDLAEAKRLAAQAPPGTRVFYVPPAGDPACIAHCKGTGPFWLVGRNPVRLREEGDRLGEKERERTPPQAVAAGLLVLTFGTTPAGTAKADEPSKPPAEPLKPPEDRAKEDKKADGPPGTERERAAAARQEMLRAYFEKTSITFNPAESGVESVATETLAILGQIVADRASGAAVELVKERLLEQLKCRRREQPADAKSKRARTDFPRTCATLESVRLQDLAGSADSLVNAVTADALAYLTARAEAAHDARVAHAEDAATANPARVARNDAQREGLALGLGLLANALPEILRTRRGMDAPIAAATPRLLMDQALVYLKAESDALVAKQRFISKSRIYVDEFAALTRGQKAVVTAALGFSQCVVANRLNECPTAEFVRKAAGALGISDDLELLVRAEALLIHVLAAQTSRVDEKPAWRLRVSHAIDATFDVTCLLVDESTDVTTPLRACPADAPTSKPYDVRGWLTAGHYVHVAAIDGDVNGVIAGVGALFDGDERKGLRLLGGVVRYAGTYAGPDGKSPDAHERRTKLLEDLTTEMTDRTEREGDGVWSLGGALMLVGGVRAPLEPGEKAAVYGPLALPLGLGFQEVGHGLHVAFGIVDLGQYIAWEPGLEVAEPDLEDALAPSLTVGYAWGKSFPAFAGLSVSYAPHYQFSDETARGSLNIGATMGVYVPFLDIN
jgi:hypothetical protein